MNSKATRYWFNLRWGMMIKFGRRFYLIGLYRKWFLCLTTEGVFKHLDVGPFCITWRTDE